MYNLMIVDDELLMRIGIRNMIQWEEHGFRIVGEAANGKEGLEVALAASPDLIITDIKMPVMDGLQFIREVSKQRKKCQFIVLSNLDELQYVKEALKLHVADYLIKSELTSAALMELLASIREQLQLESGQPASADHPYDDSSSISHKKAEFFKDLISGFMTESEADARAEDLHIRVKPADLIALTLKVNHFEAIKRKYVEKDEKLLRFSILNILEEIIPSKWEKEIVVLSSSEYLIVVNKLEGSSSARPDIEKLCAKIIASLKDFTNLSVSVGASAPASGFSSVKSAYKQAEQALGARFFASGPATFFYDDKAEEPPRKAANPKISSEEEQLFFAMLSSADKEQAGRFFAGLRSKLEQQRLDESSIRLFYILLLEKMNAYLSLAGKRPLSSFNGLSPYENVLKGDSWEDVHHGLLDYVSCCFDQEGRVVEESTYTGMAVDLIHTYFAEAISLQSVASQINVSPSYLSRIFKQEKGVNFVSYLTEVRLEKAKIYLRSGKLKVYAVAEMVGYPNYTYFSKIFKKHVGVTPEEYREQIH
ncbi:helix-turn-helix domain-containing protein [Paenibacillus sp. B01]|uniref:helix-turn-helix domain-containing protein n=1 Tax=Paenibacillus sp. B01 TaxID=2660554 RepID=UPI00129A9A11|nr:helix-turn-helix domain-containing protein [Paenibacillus sp. B01]QGG55761.1 response regulator [Paenibacillus sp. B01]